MTDDGAKAAGHFRSPLAVFFNTVAVIRFFGWATLAVLAAFLFSNFLTVWMGWPGAVAATFESMDGQAWAQAALYAAALGAAAIHVVCRPQRSLKAERESVIGVGSLILRAAFWAVLLIGIVDFAIAFLGGEELLVDVVGDELVGELRRTQFRGVFVHMPLIVVGVVIAASTRALGITWFALLIVCAELLIVMFRFIFSYEQLYMTDLVRFWYAALFLLGIAYTLRCDGHVRVDVFYAGFRGRRKAQVNILGTLLLGMPFCWLILIIGFSGRTGIVNSALLTFEIEGLGDGMYILYLMSVLLAVFAITLLIEFVAVLFAAAAELGHDPVGARPTRDT